MPRVLHWLLQMLCVALIAACSTNSPTAMAEAKKAYAAQDYALSYAKVAEQAHAGDADAQYALGYMMYYGKGTTKDVAGSYDWFRKAAAQGQPQAVKALALLHQAPVSSSAEASAANDRPSVKARAAADVSDPASAQPPVESAVVQAKSGTLPAEKTPSLADTPQLTAEGAGLQPAQDALSVQKPTVADKPKPTVAPQPVDDAGSLQPTATATPAQVSHVGQYAVQLMGASTSAPLESMMKRHHLQDAVVVKTQVKGKPWYVLLKGEYPNHDAAQHALQLLPADLKAHHPWVKTLG